MMYWYDIEKETPEIDELVLVAFKTNIGTIQYTTARYSIHNHAMHCDNYHPVWWVEVSGGMTLDSVTHWANFNLAPNDDSDVPF